MNEGKFGREEMGSREAREEEPKGREVNAYFFRHGEALGEGAEAELTSGGEEQARAAAESLLRKIQEQGGVIKFLASPVKRTERTAQIMEARVRELIVQEKIENVRVLASHRRPKLKAPGVIGALKRKGITEDPIEQWLRSPDLLGEQMTPAKVSEQLLKMLQLFRRVADRLAPGEKINYACISHEGLQSALLNQATGKKMSEFGGPLRNCESFQVQIQGKSEKNPQLTFRESQTELNL